MRRCNFFQCPKIIKRFNKSDEGVTAVEFAIVGGPFFLLIFAIIESSLFFFAGQYLESTVDETARLFRTGQFNPSTTETQFRTEFCKRLTVMFDCQAVRTEVQVAASFKGLKDPAQPNEKGELPGNVFVPTDRVQIMQLSAQYKWPVFTNYSAPLLNTSGGNFALMQVVAVTKTEPY